MKKCLYLLCICLTLTALTIPALAEEGEVSGGTYGFIENEAKNSSEIVGTSSGGIAPYCTTHSQSALVRVGQRMEWCVPSSNFQWSDSKGAYYPASLQNTDWIKLTGAQVGVDFAVAYDTPASGTSEVTVVLIPLREGSYPNLQLYLQGGLSAATTSSQPYQISVAPVAELARGISSQGRLQDGTITLNGQPLPAAQLSSLALYEGDVLLVSLPADLFSWECYPPSDGIVTPYHLQAAGIGATSARDETALVDRGGAAYLQIRVGTADPGQTAYSNTVSLLFNGQPHEGSQLRLGGALTGNDTAEGGAYFDLSDGSSLTVDKTTRARLYIGHGITLHATLSGGEDYAAESSNVLFADDVRLMDRYPTIVHKLGIGSESLDSSLTKVSFDLDEVYYVYDRKGDYLGQSNRRLPYREHYYFSTAEIDLVP